LKTHAFFQPAFRLVHAPSTRAFSVLVIVVELAVALWLLSGIRPRAAWASAVTLFMVFLAVSLSKAVGGEANCGCFGSLVVSPWTTSVIDLAVLAMLLAVRPSAGSQWGPAARRRPAALLAGGVAAIVLLAALAGLHRPGASWAESSDLVLLEPQTWIGQPFPLARSIDIGEQLMRGAWTVVLVHHDCPVCQKRIRHHLDLATRHDRQVALVQAPPHGSLTEAEGQLAMGRLSEAKTWFVQMPVEIELNNGIVTSVTSSF
jgi:hypothetical protein